MRPHTECRTALVSAGLLAFLEQAGKVCIIEVLILTLAMIGFVADLDYLIPGTDVRLLKAREAISSTGAVVSTKKGRVCVAAGAGGGGEEVVAELVAELVVELVDVDVGVDVWSS